MALWRSGYRVRLEPSLRPSDSFGSASSNLAGVDSFCFAHDLRLFSLASKSVHDFQDFVDEELHAVPSTQFRPLLSSIERHVREQSIELATYIWDSVANGTFKSLKTRNFWGDYVLMLDPEA